MHVYLLNNYEELTSYRKSITINWYFLKSINFTNSNIYLNFFIFLNFNKSKAWFIRNIYLSYKTYMKNFNQKKSIFLDFFWYFYFEFLFISLIAFLPSLRVLKTSQVREDMIKTVSVMREIKVASIFLNIKFICYLY